MVINENEYEIRKKYCPALRKNVIVKVFYREQAWEECTERAACDGAGGCRNQYLQSEERVSHSS